MPVKKMTANPLAPLRYRPGKPVGGVEESESSSEEESGSESDENETQNPKAPAPKATSFPKISAGLNKEELERRRQEAIAARAREAELAKKAEDGFETASESGSEAQGSDEEDSEEEESSSEDESRPSKPRFIAPTFVKKSQRVALNPSLKQKTAEEEAAEEERRRLEKADELLQAQIAKDAAERAAAKKAWDDDNDDAAIREDEAQVDDTDGLDPEAEYAAWKLRELKRIKREREAIQAAEAEHEEIERRRNLSAADREEEDRRYIEAQKAEKEANKGQMGFMQKYFHKGAFFQGGDEGAEGGVGGTTTADEIEAAKKRDIMGARYEDDAANRELLPKYMQIRDMTKLGKKGRTKYRDMKSEDTGRWGDFSRDDTRYGGYSKDGRFDDRKPLHDGPSGANASAVGQRTRPRPRDDDNNDRGQGGGGRDEKRRRYD